MGGLHTFMASLQAYGYVKQLWGPPHKHTHNTHTAVSQLKDKVALRRIDDVTNNKAQGGQGICLKWEGHREGLSIFILLEKEV